MWLPRGPSGRGTAVDLAVSSGLRADLIPHSAVDGSVVAARYEEHKKEYLNTEQLCKDSGFDFLPFVIEAHGGGIGALGRRLCGFVASACATEEGEEVETTAVRLHRCLFIALQRETARAVLRPLSPAAEAEVPAYPQAWRARDPDTMEGVGSNTV